MNINAKQAWQEALLSGKYAQGQYNLRKDGYFCCLGVLCDISGIGRWSILSGPQAYLTADPVAGSIRKDYPPSSVLRWAGLTQLNCKELATLNDEEGRSFKEIVEYIGTHL